MKILKRFNGRSFLFIIYYYFKDEYNFDNEMADVLYYLNALAINRGKTLNDYAELSLNKVMKYKTQKDIRHANIEHGAKN